MAPAANDAMVPASPQPSAAVRTKPYTSPVMPSVEVMAPARSKCPVVRGVSGRWRRASATSAMPTGTLMNRPRRHETQLVSMPPSTRPMLPPPLATAL